MNLLCLRLSVGLCSIAVAGSASAAIIDVTGTTLKAAFAAAQPGDTLRVIGNVGSLTLSDRSFATKLTIDATQAYFTDSLTLSNVTGLKVVGGTFGSTTTATRQGRAVAIFGGGKLYFSGNTFVGNGLGVGLSAASSTDIVVSAGTFKNLKLGASLTSSTYSRVSSSRFIGMSSDGLNIADSHFVTATANRCTGATPIAGSGFHMDCIQLWSILGRPVQSDIVITNNYVTGPMQGFTSFNASDGGGLRITMSGNVVSTSMPQGIACYACVDSIITNNTLTTLPGSTWRTSMNIVGGSNNIVEGNSIGSLADAQYLPPGYVRPASETSDSAFMTTDGPIGAAFAADFGAEFASAAAAVPDLTIWAQLLLGFALVGAAMRRGSTGGRHAGAAVSA